WFRDSFVRRNREALLCYPRRLKLFGPLPSFQDHLIDLEGERRILAHWPLLGYPELYREVRLPYVDRDLLEFVYAIPREKIVRVGELELWLRHLAVQGLLAKSPLHKPQPALFSPRLREGHSWILE